jgi:hypothetical protein
MPRVRFEELPGGAADRSEAALRKPQPPPAGYTGNTAITEWLTLHCRRDWGSISDGPVVRVRFADPEDCARARERFG